MNYRFYITRSTNTVEVFPLNFNSTSLIDEVEAGRIFRRRKFNGALMFGTNSWAEDEDGDKVNRKDDFDYFLDIEITGPCERLDFEITKDGSEYWTGYFSTSDGEFDLDKCTFTVTPLVQDKYSLFDEYGDSEYNLITGVIPFVTTTIVRGPDTYVYSRNLYLTDVITYLAQRIDPLVTLSSDFLTEAVNPVTLTTNRYDLLTIAQKSDIKRYNASDRAWKGFLSFNQVMEMVKIMNLFWDYDSVSHILYVDHISSPVFTPLDGLDLRGQKLQQSVNRYKYDKNNMPNSEVFSFMESDNPGFIQSSINYFSPCSNQDKESNVSQYSWNVTTDIEYIQDCMASTDKKSNISDDGWVMLANYDDGGDLYTYMNNTGSEIRFNGDLSWSLLLPAFFKHDRPVISGYIAGSIQDFYTTRKTRIQECSAMLCDPFDASELLTTELGETYFGGIKATVLRAEIAPTGLIKMILGYPQPENPIVPIAYDNLIRIEEIANQVYPNVPTACTYYAQTSVPTDADVTVTFTIRILTNFGEFNDASDSITIPSGTTSGNVTINWPAPSDPLDANVCRFGIYFVSVVGGAMSWEYAFVYDTDASCV